MTTVSIQIVTFNSADDIGSCLEAVFAQNYPISKVIVIDNQSSDHTVDQIRKSPYNERTVLIENRSNNGFAGGHNQGFNLSDSDYVLVLNPDVELHLDYVYYLVKVMEQEPQIGSATGKLFRNKEQKVLDSTGLIMKKNRRAFDRGAGEIDQGQYDQNIDIFGVSGAAAMYRRTMIHDISLNRQFFDEVYFAYKEDVDVAWRAQLFGWKAQYVPDAIAYHKRGWSGKSERQEISLKIRQHSYMNRYYTIFKNDLVSHFFLHLPVVLFYEVLAFGYAMIKERDVLQAWADFKKNLPLMHQKRKMIQTRKKESNPSIYRFFKGIW